MLELSEMAEHAKLLQEATDLLDNDLDRKPAVREKFEQDFARAGWVAWRMRASIKRARTSLLDFTGLDGNLDCLTTE